MIIPGPFGFNCPSGFREEAFWNIFPIGSNAKLPRNDHWKVLYKFYVFYVDRKSKMATTTIHRLTLDPMGKCSNKCLLLRKRRSVLKHFSHWVQC
jgi:hypothetical protein